MGNIIGEGFNKKIKLQVEKRQEVFGTTNKSNYQRYLNGRNAWIKLTSSVNIDENTANSTEGEKVIEKLRKYNIETSPGNTLAKDYVLFGGVSIGDNIRKGLNQTYTIGNSQGFRPMPGITSLDSKNRNRGSLRETNVTIKAYNTEQFTIIDTLYLRLGYTVLIEWGHSVYIDNNGAVKDMTSSDTLSSNFLNGTYKNQEELYKKIIENKLRLEGNYDAIYGKITNFSWSFEQDGTYNINLKIISLGDVIESLKINTIALGKFISSEEKKEAEENLAEADTDSEILIYSANKDSICKLFFDAKELLVKSSRQGSNEGIVTISDEEAKTLGFNSGNDFAMFEEVTRLNENRYYVRLGGFLQYMQDNKLFYDNNETPCIEIDFDEATNLIFTTPYVLSADPRICIVKTSIDMEGLENSPITVFEGLPKDFKEEVAGVLVGKLMNVYINTTYIVKAMESLKDPDNKDKVSLFDLLNYICEGINSSLGNLNTLSPVVDEEENRLYLLDETPLPNKTEIIKAKITDPNTDLTVFEIFGYKPNNSSFITELGIKTEISNNLATMITVGAQANGEAVGEDATAFSKWNNGLTDRVFKVKNSKEDINKVEDENFQKQKEEEIKNTIKEYSNFVTKISEFEFDDSIEEFPTVLTNFLNLLQAEKSQNEKTSSGTLGFIPINLNLTMVGLSGMKIYQKFIVSQNFLPYNYGSTLDFLIKGISHKIDNNGWLTTIESLSIPNTVSNGADQNIKYIKPPLTTTEGKSAPASSSARKALSSQEIQQSQSTLAGIKPGSCLAKVGPNINVPGILIPNQRNQYGRSISVDERKAALQKGYDSTFYEGQFKSGMCGRYTYTHAYNYIQSLNNKPTIRGAIAGGGNTANSPVYWGNLIKLGYTQYVVGKNITKTELTTAISSIQYNLGDVIVYWANENPNDGGASQYGHTQMYIGKNQIKEKIDPGKPPSGWTTDRFTNYGTSFVYRSNDKYPYNCWNILIFRIPY